MSDWGEAYPQLHRALAPEYRELPAEQVGAIVGQVLGPGATLVDAEGWLSDVGRTLGQVGQAAAPILQGAASGAVGGAALGPYGMLGGAILGGVGSALSGAGGRRPVPPGAPPPGMSAAPVGGSAASQLLAALASPTVRQALSALLMGGAGARSVPTATGQQVPVAAVTNMLGMLAGRASAEQEAFDLGEAPWREGEGIDEADPEARASWLYERLLPIESSAANGGGRDEAWLDEMYDELEADFYGDVRGG